MAKKSIENRYSIDYVYPDDSSKSQSSGKKSFTTLILSVITLGLIASFLLPLNIKEFIHNITKKSENTPPVVKEEIDKEKVIAKIDVDTTVTTSTNTTEVKKTKPIKLAVIKKETPILKKADEIPVVVAPVKVKPVEVIIETTPKKTKVSTPPPVSINNEQLAASLKQLTINAELNKKLEDLSKQLLAERKKTEVLSSQLKVRRNRNNALSGMLKNALDKASDADKRYVAALNGQTQKIKTKKAKIDIKRARNDIAKRITLDTKQVDYNNSFTVTSTKQIDAILAAMQTSSPKPLKEVAPVNTGSTIVQIPTNKQNTSTQVYASLQDQINILINNDNEDDTLDDVELSNNPNNDLENEYKKALNLESNVRSNEVRSIVIIKGDTLWAIAKRAYGNGADYKKIINANPNIVKNGKVRLLVGQVIRVPI